MTVSCSVCLELSQKEAREMVLALKRDLRVQFGGFFVHILRKLMNNAE